VLPSLSCGFLLSFPFLLIISGFPFPPGYGDALKCRFVFPAEGKVFAMLFFPLF